MTDENAEPAAAEVDPDKIVAALRGAFARDVEQTEMLRIATSRLVATGSPFQAAQVYLVDDRGLRRAMASGSAFGPERIAKATLDSNDSFVGVLADSGVRSAVMIPIKRGTTVLGGLAVGSMIPEAFANHRMATLQKIAEALAVLL